MTFVINDATILNDLQRGELQTRGIVVKEVPITRVSGDADVISRDGRTLSCAGLFTPTKTAPASRPSEHIVCHI